MTVQSVAPHSKRFSWVPTENRVKLARDVHFLLIYMGDRIYSVPVDYLLEVIAGHRESLRLFVLERHES